MNTITDIVQKHNHFSNDHRWLVGYSSSTEIFKPFVVYISNVLATVTQSCVII